MLDLTSESVIATGPYGQFLADFIIKFSVHTFLTQVTCSSPYKHPRLPNFTIPREAV